MRKLTTVILTGAVSFILALAFSSCGGGDGGGNSGGGGIPPGSKVIFVTSVTGNGNLGSWADAGGNTGLAAGDAICQARADAAGLTGTFIAWLSDDSNDAYCRLHNLTGKKADNCGQTALPADAGPWVRTDGFPFGPAIDQLIFPSSIVYAPVRYDEFGSLIAFNLSFNNKYLTGTRSDGTLDFSFPSVCSNWTSNGSESVLLGSIHGTTAAWTFDSWTLCSGEFRLLCVQTGAGVSLPSFATTGKKAFYTSVSGTGNLSSWPDAGVNTGLAAGDAICKARAAAAGLTNANNFKAWLSDSTMDAKDRITSNGPWVRPDGVKVAENLSDLTGRNLFSSINQDETGTYGNFFSEQWTGTDDFGIKTADICNGWTDSTGALNGTVGRSDFAYESWSASGFFSCDRTKRLYCFED